MRHSLIQFKSDRIIKQDKLMLINELDDMNLNISTNHNIENDIYNGIIEKYESIN